MEPARIVQLRSLLGPVRALSRRLLPAAVLLRFPGFVSVGDQKRISFLHACVDTVGDPDLRINLLNNQSWPLRDSGLRSIYSAHCLEHIPDRSAEVFFRETLRVLRTGGELLLDVPSPERAFKMMHRFLDDPLDLSFRRYIRDMSITPSKIAARLPSHLDSAAPKEWAASPLNVITFAIFANYLYPKFGSEHLPVIHDPSDVEARVRELSLEQFAEWAISALPEDLRFSGGHCNFWTARKVSIYGEKFGFSVASRVHGESRTLPSFLVPDSAYERRDLWSAKYSLIKL